MPDDSYISRLFQVESAGDPSAVTGSNRGLGQFSPDLERQYGITDWKNPDQQKAAVDREYADHVPVLTQALGRPPTPGESYLAHQQGLTGASKLLTADPNTPAWQVIRPYYKSDRMAQLAINGNIENNHPLKRVSPDQISAGAFTGYWKNKFEGGLPGAQIASGGPLSAAAIGRQTTPAGVPLFGGNGQASAPQAPQAAPQGIGGAPYMPPVPSFLPPMQFAPMQPLQPLQPGLLAMFGKPQGQT